MDQLPQELISKICSYLPEDDLPNIYYVSTKFRKSAEDQAKWHRRGIWELTKKNKQSFLNDYSGFRLRYLYEVKFNPYFPKLDVNNCGCCESTDEQHEKDQMFTEQIQDLFATLKTVEERAGERNRGNYRLTIYSPYQDWSGQPCNHRKHMYWRTHLLEPETLPELMSVRYLGIENGHFEAKLDYRILIDLSTRLPNLGSLECHIGADEWTPSYQDAPAKCTTWEYDGPRRDTRHDFGKAITTTNIPRSLWRVDLDFLCRRAMAEADSIHHWKTMPNLVSPATKDPFSTSLRILSSFLRVLTIRAQVDDSLFWPEDGSTPNWPYLQNVSIMFHMVSPSGAWFFEGPRGEGRESIGYEVNESSYPPLEPTDDDDVFDWECNQWHSSFESTSQYWFRISPNEKILGPFLASFAKAATNMPKLEKAVLWSPLKWDVENDDNLPSEAFNYFEPPGYIQGDYYAEDLAWGLAYHFPRASTAFAKNPGEVKCEARQIWWKVGKWRPNPELHDLFHQIGRKEHGEALKEHWDDDKFSQELVWRGYFDHWTPDE
ncbi:hypothetical protein BKA66DRAFT_490929 [Pyrenochaeta sp. MPI-SDFR-AT-0127]|nr:hypothetical protein BKA66DRAFT_490929 [Pyrenochaeta sp. MPI-SDFR-AT-0127]